MKKTTMPISFTLIKDGTEKTWDYGYLTDCTDEHVNVTSDLDKLKDKKGDVKITDIYKIVLWKTNRFPVISEDVLASLSGIKHFKTDDIDTEEWKNTTTNLIDKLLDKKRVRGVDLPMASTIFRFINPQAYQIIDARAYNAIYGQNMPKSKKNVAKIYIDYMKDLLEKFKNGYDGKKIEKFEEMDRFLYLYDIRSGHKIHDTKSTK